MPTITHYIVPSADGRIAGYSGLSEPLTSPYFIDLQLYDDVGDVVRRPPLRNRASGYFVLGGASFDVLEREVLRLLDVIDVRVDPA